MSFKSSYDYFIRIANNDLLQMSAEDICKRYTDTKDESIIATMFCKMYNTLISYSSKYWCLTDDDKVSATLSMLPNIMEKFSETKQKSFSSFFKKSFDWAVYRDVRALGAKKRVCPTSMDSLDNPYLNDTHSLYEVVSDRNVSNPSEDIDNLNFLRSVSDTEMDYQIFKLLYEGYEILQISKKLSIDTSYIKKLLKTKHREFVRGLKY